MKPGWRKRHAQTLALLNYAKWKADPHSTGNDMSAAMLRSIWMAGYRLASTLVYRDMQRIVNRAAGKAVEDREHEWVG